MKTLIYLVLTIALIIYLIVVWGWIQQGNRNFNQPLNEDIVLRY